MNTYSVNVRNLLAKLDTINEDNLNETELHLYALKGFASDNEEIVEFCDMLIVHLDNAFSYMYIEENWNMETQISKFKNIIEVMQYKWA